MYELKVVYYGQGNDNIFTDTNGEEYAVRGDFEESFPCNTRDEALKLAKCIAKEEIDMFNKRIEMASRIPTFNKEKASYLSCDKLFDEEFVGRTFSVGYTNYKGNVYKDRVRFTIEKA